MSFFAKFKPARSQAAWKDADAVVDLDRMVCDPIKFKLNGKAHFVRPMDTVTFLRVTNEMARIDLLRSKKEHDATEVYDSYARIFAAVCDTISRKDVDKMSIAQIGALFQMVLDCVTGKAYAEQAQKKNARNLKQQPASSKSTPD